MYYTYENNCVVIKRHILLLIFSLFRFIFLLSICFFLYFLLANIIPDDSTALKYTAFFFIFSILNYGFFRFILSVIEYSFNLIIVSYNKIYIIKSSLILKDDIEIIDAYRIMKLDTYSRGFWANIFRYGNLVIEQQKDNVRTFHFVPESDNALKIINNQREKVLNDKAENKRKG